MNELASWKMLNRSTELMKTVVSGVAVQERWVENWWKHLIFFGVEVTDSSKF
jgi:hypothetical protein